MRHVTRKQFIAGGAAAFASIAILRRPADAADFSYKLGFNFPTNHPATTRANEAAAKILQASNGRLEIKVFPNSLLGNDTSMLAQVRTGAAELVMMADPITATVVPVAAIDSVAFAFPSYQAAWAASDGSLGKLIRTAIAKAIDVYPLDKAWDAGFKQMCNGLRTINGPDEVKGLKVRVADAPMTIDLYRALGASPVAINVNELYTSLQTHLVDGADLALGTFQSGKYYEVQRYLAITNHSWTPFSMLANREAWQKLPSDLRDIADRELNAAAVLQRNDMARLALTSQDTIKGEGVAISNPTIEPFRKVLRASGMYAKWRDQMGAQAWGVLESSVGKL